MDIGGKHIQSTKIEEIETQTKHIRRYIMDTHGTSHVLNENFQSFLHKYMDKCTGYTGVEDLTKYHESSVRDRKDIVAYTGFYDENFSLKNLAQIMALRCLAKNGVKCYALIDDSLGYVSAKVTDRFVSMVNVFIEDTPFLNIEFNSKWYRKKSLLSFLREHGARVHVDEMLIFEQIRSKLYTRQNVSLTDLHSISIKMYDVFIMYDEYRVSLCVDTEDNYEIVSSAVEGVKKYNDDPNVFGISLPYLFPAKKEIFSDDCTPYDYFQFWRNTKDSDVKKYLKLFTELPANYIQEMAYLDINSTKIRLAEEACIIRYGKESTEKVMDAVRGKSLDGLPTYTYNWDVIHRMPYTTILKEIGMVKTTSEARRLIKGRGVKINDLPTENVEAAVLKHDVKDGKIKLSVGKKRHAIIQVVT